MKFSLRTLLFVIGFYAAIIAVAASQSLLGYMFMTFLALVVLPPFVQVGVFTTRGPRQAFFIGAAVAGLPHFIATFYFVGFIADFDFDNFFAFSTRTLFCS